MFKKINYKHILFLDKLKLKNSICPFFGIRPLSFHYLDLYDQELQELRKKVKPGLVPPFYADLPETFEEICDSERRYIKAFLKHPLKTQCTYFWRSFINIAIKGARSK